MYPHFACNLHPKWGYLCRIKFSYKLIDMTKKQQQKNASPECIVRYAHVNNFQAVVYDDFSGIPQQVTFLGKNWWLTTPGMKLQLLKDYCKDMPGIDFNYLCEAQGSVGALALAKLLGKALEEPEGTLEEVMNQRVRALRQMGVTFNVDDEVLQLELRVFENGEKSKRQGRYSAWGHTAGSIRDMLFDIDGFDAREDALEWVDFYLKFLKSMGFKFTIVYNK